MKYFFLIFIVVYLSVASNKIFAQKERGGKIGKITRPEKCWAISHPFIVKKTIRITKEVVRVSDSIYHSRTLGSGLSVGRPNAFKHAYWMALLCRDISARKAFNLGKAHEKGNYITYKKAMRKGLIDSHTKTSSEMDMWNNIKGIEIGKANKYIPDIQLQQVIIDSILAGGMRIIIIDTLKGGEMLVPSNHQ